ncbi:MAG: SUMF1/EgtB/PvdO family nonheme iron enzyme [Planctomycetes bacterium]|nr:SUMF1/EgtB/PvdO family nonheme iron enzyme [Planctomycetota bacterium]
MTGAGRATGAGEEDPATRRFAEFLAGYHAGEGSLDALCAAHPEHEPRFRRWWARLLAAGEVRSGGHSSAGERFGPYRLVRELGRGAQGVVHLAVDERLGREVALKILPAHRALGSEFVRRFAREAELASRLDHPGIGTVYERGEVGGTPFLALRYVRGETLAEGIARAQQRAGGSPRCVRLAAWPDGETIGETQAIARLCLFLAQVADALHVAHAANLVHRDVKPGNVLIDAKGNPVVVDFGLARDLEEPALTLTGDLVGTPAYMAPEQLAALRIPPDARADVYSLGVTLYECLTLRRPFTGATRAELYQQILASDPPPPRALHRGITRDLQVVVLTAMDRDRRRRYAGMAEFAADLRAVAAGAAIQARPPGPLRRVLRLATRNPGLASAVVAVVAILGVGLVLSLAYVREARRARTAFERLGDRTLLAGALAAVDSLYPVRPERAAAFAEWQARHVAPLRERLPAHRAELAALESAASPRDPERDQLLRQASPLQAERTRLAGELTLIDVGLEERGGPRIPMLRRLLEWRAARQQQRILAIDAELDRLRAWRFPSPEAQAAHAALRDLVRDIGAFLAPGGLAERVARDADLAARIHAESVVAHAEAWRGVAARVARRDPGRTIGPQIGLVPLGPDPASGLEEFCVLGSGTLPARDPASGRLQLGAEHGLVLVLLPAGEVRLWDDDAPRSDSVALDWFLLAKHELTRGQWRRLFGGEPPGNDLLLANGCDRDDLPVEAVPWDVAVEHLGRHGLLLPSEAQWEYAARGGAQGRHWWGEGLPPNSPPPANVRDASYLTAALQPRAAGFNYDDGFALLAPIARTRANEFGLYDVYGNVAEWCREAFVPGSLAPYPRDAGDGYHRVPAYGQRTVRGGSFLTLLRNMSLGIRDGMHETVAHVGVGVRPARRVE